MLALNRYRSKGARKPRLGLSFSDAQIRVLMLFLYFVLAGTLVGCNAPRNAQVISQGGPRVALVIGNGAYSGGVRPLANPPHDATAVAALLQRRGFKTVLVLDAGLAELRSAVQAFAAAADRADVAIVFYSGHAVELDGRNMLVPVDLSLSAISSKSEFENRVLPITDVDMALAGRATTTLILLDSCRDDPFTEAAGEGRDGDAQSRGVTRTFVSERGGLALESAPHVSAIVYATESGKVAFDGAGAFSPFTTALLEHVATTGGNLPHFLRDVRLSVSDATGGTQVPSWDRHTLPARALFSEATAGETEPLVWRMITAAHPASDVPRTASVPEGKNRLESEFRGLPLEQELLSFSGKFQCDAKTGRGWARWGGIGSITVSQDGLACGMQIFSYPDRNIPATNLIVAASPANGHVVIERNSFAYTPNPGFSGTDTFKIAADNNMHGTISVTVLPDSGP